MISNNLRYLPFGAYNLSKFVYLCRLYVTRGKYREMWLVYQMGKVGSSSIVKSLKDSNVINDVYHIHDLNDDTLKRDEEIYKRQFGVTRLFPYHLWQAQFVKRILNREKGSKIWKIVSLVRDPVARNISTFFQTLRLEHSIGYHEDPEGLVPERLNELFRVFLEDVENHDYPLKWFDAELNANFGVDVYAKEFIPHEGYQIYKDNAERVHVLVMRLEDLDRIGHIALSEFVGNNKIILCRKNVGATKAYKKSYQHFLDEIKLPISYVEEMYSSRYMKHFYAEQEICKLRQRWTGCT